ncbi:MAG: heme exporter protein CcmB [Chloroflexi bacterium]|nr:heme exporter protein CcmB [Chloroflexota bacterium]
MKFILAVFAIFRKDLLGERRSSTTLGAMMVFALIVILVFAFAFNLSVEGRRDVATGVIWVTICFAGTLGLDRTLAQEKESDAMDGLMLSPVDRTAIFFAKVLVNWFYLGVCALFVVFFYSLFNNIHLFNFAFFGVILLGTLGYILTGTLLATIAQQLNTRGGLLLPVLLFPLIIPLVLAAVNASERILGGDPGGELGRWIALLIGYDLLFLAVGILFYDKILED